MSYITIEDKYDRVLTYTFNQIKTLSPLKMIEVKMQTHLKCITPGAGLYQLVQSHLHLHVRQDLRLNTSPFNILPAKTESPLCLRVMWIQFNFALVQVMAQVCSLPVPH